MSTKHHIPRLNPEFVRSKLVIRPSHIERFGVFAKETISSGKRVIQYAGERISEREVARRTVRNFAGLTGCLRQAGTQSQKG